MNKNLSNVIDSVLLVFGFTYALSDIESILGIIILCIQIIWLFSKFFLKVYAKIKNKDYDSIDKDVEDLENELKDKIESTKEGEEHGNK